MVLCCTLYDMFRTHANRPHRNTTARLASVISSTVLLSVLAGPTSCVLIGTHAAAGMDACE